MERIAMNQEERDWLDWLKRARDGTLTQRQAAGKMGVTDRWVRELLARMEEEGDGVVVQGLRGQVSNHRIAEKVQQRALKLLRQPEWHDFGPTFASEQLAKRYRIEVSKETVRGWMIGAGLWKAHPRSGEAGSLLAAAAKLLWRTGAVGHLGSRLAGRPGRAGALLGADDR
jgi:DNA-binding Lrp family transcriptional regulator